MSIASDLYDTDFPAPNPRSVAVGSPALHGAVSPPTPPDAATRPTTPGALTLASPARSTAIDVSTPAVPPPVITDPVSHGAHRAAVSQHRAEAVRLGDDIAELSARIQAATYELLVLIRAFDEREGWEGCQSCAHWLNWRTGLKLGAAREKVRVARALGALPLLSDAMQRGQISYSKVRALTRVATPANERRLLDFALCAPASYVERLARAWRRVDRATEAADDQRRQTRRHLNTWVDDDGMVVIRGRLSPEVGAVVRRAIEAASDRLRTAVAAADAAETSTVQRQADALGLVAESALAADLDRGTAGDRYQVVLHVEPDTLQTDAKAPASHVSAETSRDAKARAARAARVSEETPPGAAAPATHVSAETSSHAVESTGRGCLDAGGRPVAATPAARMGGHAALEDGDGLRVSAETSSNTARSGGRGCPDTGGRPVAATSAPRMAGHAALEDGDGLRVSAETSRRMACDAAAVVMQHAPDGAILDVGRKTRTIPPALRRALQTRDRQCRFPGCHARRCDAHHVRHWADGGATRLDNLVLLCRRHHRAVHEEGFTVRLDPAGDAEFCWPDGRPFPAVPPPPRWSGPPLAPTDARLAASAIVIDADTATPDWHGERLDAGFAIDVMWMPRTAPGAAAGAPL